MRVESHAFSVSWVPSDVVAGAAKLPFLISVARADEPPPDRVGDPQDLLRGGTARQVNDLRAWVEFDDHGTPIDFGYGPSDGSGWAQLEFPDVRREPEVEGNAVRFVQTSGGRIGGAVPHRVRGRPFMRFSSPVAWTTLALTISADGRARAELAGASPFPRHWLYGADGALVAKSAEADYANWLGQASVDETPWGAEDSPQLVAAAESALERRLADRIMDAKLRVHSLPAGAMLVEQGDAGQEVFLLVDGLLDVEVGGQAIAEVGPGAIVGERASLDGRRTATLRARTDCRVVALQPESLTRSEREQLAASHRREED
jgi:Cyclic nucleotide-binding domain